MNIFLYEDSDFKIFSEYINNFFKPNYILGYKEYINWQYENSFYILKIENKIVGHFGFRDISYKIEDKIEDIRVLVNLFVIPELRIAGGGAFLAKKVFDTKNNILVSGYTSLSQKLFTNLSSGWKEMGNLSRFIKILNPNNFFLKEYKTPLVVSRNQNYSNLEIRPEKDPVIMEKAWLVNRERYKVTVERSRNYLKWRFFDNPFIEYNILSCFKNNLVCGYIVGRIELDQGFKIARIIDLISTEESECSLMEGFVRWADENSCDAVDFLFSGNFLYKMNLEKSGFFNVLKTDFENFPILFSPISFNKSFINVASSLDFPLDECYFTKADGDQDRPNPH